MRGLSENSGEGLPKGGLIGRSQSSKLFEHEGRVDGGEDWFEHRELEQPRSTLVLNLDLAHGACGWPLTGDRHDEEVRPGTVIGSAADNDGGAALTSRLIREGERYEDNIPELIAGHSRRRQDCPIPASRPRLRVVLPPV